VGGEPLSSIALEISPNISLGREVSLGRAVSSSEKSTVFISILGLYTALFDFSSNLEEIMGYEYKSS
jgi:hypothetical protein